MNAPWDRERTAEPITRARKTAPSSNKEFRSLPLPPQVQSLSCLQLLQQGLQRHQWESTFSVDCRSSQHAQWWKVSSFLGPTMIGESGWFTNKDAAKEHAAMQALAWLDTHYPQFAPSRAAVPLSNCKAPTPPPPPPPPLQVQPPSIQQLLQERLQKYQCKATFGVDCSGPQHAQSWKVSFSVGTTMIGESTWVCSNDAVENAAMQALGWLNTHGYP